MAETNPNYRSNLKKIMIISTFGGLLFGYDTGVVNGALPFMAAPDQLNLDPLQEGMVVSALLIGAAIGALTGGRLSDIQGRKRNILTLSVIFFLATLGCSLAPDFHIMLISRFVLGLAVGGASTTVPAYLAEISPAETRGRMVTQNELMIVSGQFLAFVINAIIAVVMEGNPHVWRYMLAVAAVPAVALFLGIQYCPESPRWLASKGRMEDSLGVLKTIRDTVERAERELAEIKDILARAAQADSIQWAEINQAWVRRLLLIGLVLAAFTQTTGINSIMYYGSQVLTEAGLSRQAAIIANTLNGFISVVGTLIGIYLMKTMSRRKMLTIGFCGTTLSMFLISVAASTISEISMFPYVVLGLIMCFLFSMQSFIGPIFWLAISEIIPLRFRGFGMGFCVLFLWMTNFFISLSFPSLLANFGLETTFIIFAVIGVGSITFTRFFMPETMGKSLEEIEEQFRHCDRRVTQAVGKNLQRND